MTNEKTLSVEQKKRKAEYQKKYQKEHPEYQAKKTREYAHRNKDKIREKAKRAYERNKNRFIIRTKTRQENEKTGICSDCQEVTITEFHHLSYEPNLFIEVCRNCHNKRHGRKTWKV